MKDSAMTFAFDMRGLQTYSLHRGIGVHWREIMRELSQLDTENQFLLIYAKGFPASDDEIRYPDNFHKIYINVPAFRKKRSLLYLWTLDHRRMQNILRQHKVNAVLLTTFAEVWFPDKQYSDIPTLVWVYDLIPFIFERHYLRDVRFGNLKLPLMKRKLKHTALADRIITSSESTKDDWLKLTGYPSEYISVIPLGVRQEFSDVKSDDIRQIRIEFNLPDRFILYLGGIDPRKNLNRALEAYAKALSDVGLPPIVIAGKMNTTHHDYIALIEKIKEFSLDEKVIFIGFVPDELLASLYSVADFLLFPSLCEGFGLPVLEAMAVGCPVLTSNVSAMPEVAADAALLVDPYNIDEIREGILTIATDSSLRNKLAQFGKKRAKKFGWKRTAEILLQILRKTAGVANER